MPRCQANSGVVRGTWLELEATGVTGSSRLKLWFYFITVWPMPSLARALRLLDPQSFPHTEPSPAIEYLPVLWHTPWSSSHLGSFPRLAQEVFSSPF